MSGPLTPVGVCECGHMLSGHRVDGRCFYTTCQCSTPVPRDGMLRVYDWHGHYRGCIGVETWERLLREQRD